MNLHKTITLLALISLFAASCSKDILNKKPDDTIAQPVTIDDFQKLLDGIEGGAISNSTSLFSYLSLGNFLSDEYNVTDNNYNTWFASNAFITGVIKWDKNMFNSLTRVDEWDRQYRTILNANIALEGINGIAPTPATQSTWNNVKGMGLFIRGQLFFSLAQFWAKPYNAGTAGTDQGIVLRLGSDADVASVRSSVSDTYKQIISDLKASIPLLPNSSVENTQVSKVRPSKAAAYGALARTYLAMGDSANTFKYADSALMLYSTLMDFNTISSIVIFNPEVVHSAVDMRGTLGSIFGYWTNDTNRVKAYDDNDLRKKLFFVNSPVVGGWVFVGDYSGNYNFTGIAVDELYLMRAEASARMGNAAAAMQDINSLLRKRYKTGTYTDRTAASPADALVQVLEERKKELIGRGMRWTDLRRLNTDSRFATTLSRKLLGQTYTLPPNDSRYTLQVPQYIINLTSSIEQTK